MKMVLDLHQMDYKKPTPISSLIIAAFKKRGISGKQAAAWSSQHSATHLVHVLYYYIWNAGRGKVRNRHAYITSVLNNDYSLDEKFFDWFKNERNKINDDPKSGVNLKRLVNL